MSLSYSDDEEIQTYQRKYPNNQQQKDFYDQLETDSDFTDLEDDDKTIESDSENEGAGVSDNMTVISEELTSDNESNTSIVTNTGITQVDK
jgi:hypothetical protein